MKYQYGSFGNKELFLKRLFCKHRFIALDMHGIYQRCGKCGLYRSVKRKGE